MKKKGLALATILLFSGLSTSIFTSCDDDTNNYLQVKVVDVTTELPIAGTIVSVSAEGSTIEKIVATDSAGISNFTFAAPAVFEIVATYNIDSLSNSQTITYREGSSSARLKDGDTVFVTIALPAEHKTRSRN